MTRRTLGLMVLGAGLLLIVYAMFFMSVSIGGGIVNMHLLNTRQNLVILGGLAVLIGALLLALPLHGGGTEDARTRRQSSIQIRLDGWQWAKLLTSLAFPVGIYFLASYLFRPQSEIHTYELFAGLALTIVPWWFSGRLILLWLVPVGLWLLYDYTKLPPWKSGSTELAFGVIFTVLPLVVTRRRLTEIYKNLRRSRVSDRDLSTS